MYYISAHVCIGLSYIDEELCAFMILVKILGKKETRTKEDPLLFAFEKCKVITLLTNFGV